MFAEFASGPKPRLHDELGVAFAFDVWLHRRNDEIALKY